MGNIFFEITVILCIAAGLAITFRLLKQPPILAYLLTGVIIGPLAFVTIHNQDAIRSMAEIGVTLLLFTLGLELKISDLKSVGRTSILAGILQIAVTAVLAFGISIFLGFPYLESFYISIALTFSSTIIIVKLLSDKKDLHSLYGKISVGILLVQDFLAIGVLILLAGISSGTAPSPASLAMLALKAIVLFGWIYVLGKTLLPYLVEKLARSPELLFLFALAWVFGLSAFVASPIIGFSIEIGGFLAGLALANTSENYQISANVRSLRDFFIIIFFVILGSQMTILTGAPELIPIIILLAFVLFLKPFIILGILALLGHRRRVSFFSSLSFAQISEFSLVIIFTGQRVHQVSDKVAAIITTVGAISFVVSTYFVLSADRLFTIFSPHLELFEKKNLIKTTRDKSLKNHVILVGANRMGESILKALEGSEEKFVVVDFDPDIIKRLTEDGITSFFGDIIDREIQDLAGLEDAKLVISTVPDVDDNVLLLSSIKKLKKKPKVLVAAFEKNDAQFLYSQGADYVVLPHIAGGHHLAKIILDENHVELIEKYRARDLKDMLS